MRLRSTANFRRLRLFRRRDSPANGLGARTGNGNGWRLSAPPRRPSWKPGRRCRAGLSGSARSPLPGPSETPARQSPASSFPRPPGDRARPQWTARCWRAGRGSGGRHGPEGRAVRLGPGRTPGVAAVTGPSPLVARPGRGRLPARGRGTSVTSPIQGGLRDLGRKRRGGLGSLGVESWPFCKPKLPSARVDPPDGAPPVPQLPPETCPRHLGLGASRGACYLVGLVSLPEMCKVAHSS